MECHTCIVYFLTPRKACSLICPLMNGNNSKNNNFGSLYLSGSLTTQTSKQGVIYVVLSKTKTYNTLTYTIQFKGPFCDSNMLFLWHSSVDIVKISPISKFLVNSKAAFVNYARLLHHTVASASSATIFELCWQA